MLTIRPEQMAVFADASVSRFERRMLGHIAEYFPAHYEIVGEQALRATIRLGVERGQAYGLTTQRDLYHYVPLMLLLGSYFDEDPQLPWAAAILKDEAVSDPGARAERLYDEAMAYLDAVAGEEGELLLAALKRLRERPVAQVWQPGSENVQTRVAGLLREVWPQKARRVGADALAQVARCAAQAARDYDVPGDLGIAVFATLMFMLGSGFSADPQFPWAAEILNDRSPEGRQRKAERLHEAGMKLADQWLARA